MFFPSGFPSLRLLAPAKWRPEHQLGTCREVTPDSGTMPNLAAAILMSVKTESVSLSIDPALPFTIRNAAHRGLHRRPAGSLCYRLVRIVETLNIKRRGSDSYVFSELVAEVIAENFAGMRMPGVGGSPGAHDNNVVIFNRHPEWTNWLEPGALPYRLTSPDGQHTSVDHVAVAA